jgi:HAD superfamily hydrolase (TIGR01509 family)
MRAVIFDFDGVLVNSEPLHFRAMRDALVPCGFVITTEEYEKHYLAYDDREAMRVALEIHGQPAGADAVDQAARRKAEIFETIIGEIPFFDGAKELVADLARQMPIAIASGALRAEIEHILSAGGLRAAFDAIVGADDVRQCKPHPEPYLAAMARLEVKARDLAPAECLVVEDSMAGIASGLAAGMKVLGVAHTYPPDKLSAAHHVVPSLRGVATGDLRALFT